MSSEDRQHTHWQGQRSHHLWHCAHTHIHTHTRKHTHTHTQTCTPTHTSTHTHKNTRTHGHPMALELDLPLGRSPNQTDKSLTDGSWQRDYHRDRRSVCSCGWWSLQRGGGGGERTLCTFSHLALLSHHTSFKVKLAAVWVRTHRLSIICMCESGAWNKHVCEMMQVDRRWSNTWGTEGCGEIRKNCMRLLLTLLYFTHMQTNKIWIWLNFTWTLSIYWSPLSSTMCLISVWKNSPYQYNSSSLCLINNHWGEFQPFTLNMWSSLSCTKS